MSQMWTKEHRERQKAFEQRRYPTDLTDKKRERIRSMLPQHARRRRKLKVDLREILNAIRYLARAGRGWRLLPHEFGPGRQYTGGSGVVPPAVRDPTRCHADARPRALRPAGEPDRWMIESQTFKAPAAPGGGGNDAAKKVKGRKQHIAVDTDGFLLMVNLTAADALADRP
jgi:putative transposase